MTPTNDVFKSTFCRRCFALLVSHVAHSCASWVFPRRTACGCSKFWQVCFHCSNRTSLSPNFLLLLSFFYLFLCCCFFCRCLSESFLFQASTFTLASGSTSSLTSAWRPLDIYCRYSAVAFLCFHNSKIGLL